jgi:uncharacterized protein
MTSDEENLAVGNPLSPCVRNCCLDHEDICMGCLRSITEICAWHEASDAEKVATLIRCRERYKARYEKTKRG